MIESNILNLDNLLLHVCSRGVGSGARDSNFTGTAVTIGATSHNYRRGCVCSVFLGCALLCCGQGERADGCFICVSKVAQMEPKDQGEVVQRVSHTRCVNHVGGGTAAPSIITAAADIKLLCQCRDNQGRKKGDV